MNRRRLFFVALALALPLALFLPLRAARSWQPRLSALPAQFGGGTSDLQWRQNGITLASPYLSGRAFVASLEVESWNGGVPIRAVRAERIAPDESGTVAASSALVGSKEAVTLWDLRRGQTAPASAALQRAGGQRERGSRRTLGSPIALSPDGTRVACTSYDPAEILLADAHSGRRVAGFKLPGWSYPLALAFAPDGDQLAVVGQQTVWIVDAQSGQLVRSWLQHSGPMNRALWSPDGTRLALAWGETPAFQFKAPLPGQSVGPQIWTILTVHDAQSGAVVREQTETARPDEYRGVTNIAFSGDGARISWGTYETGARLMNIASGAIEQRIQLPTQILSAHTVHPYHPESAHYVAFSPDGRTLAVTSQRQIMLRRMR